MAMSYEEPGGDTYQNTAAVCQALESIARTREQCHLVSTTSCCWFKMLK